MYFLNTKFIINCSIIKNDSPWGFGVLGFWGFIAKTDGVHKGIPHKKGDVFKAAGWRAPAKWARGNIFDGGKFYRWTGPNYLV